MSVFKRFTLLIGSTVVLSAQPALAEDFLVDSLSAYQKAVSDLAPGDRVILKNGVYEDFEIVFDAEGTADEPIELTVEEKGKVILSGQSSLAIGGKHLVVSGLVFKDGYSPSGAVVNYQVNKNRLANHVRVTELVIEDYSKPDRFENDYWVALYGKHNRLDHSYLAGKRNRGVTVAVRLNSEESIENHHRIDNNYFGFRPELGSNGGETLRIGTSHYSLEDSFTLVENNVFDKCNGEVEIISVKSGSNTLKGNTFIESRGTLTLRHGNGNKILENVFLGNGVANTGGVRIINEDQEVANNVFKSLTGYRFGSGFTIMNGVPNSPINRYHQVKNAYVHHNTFIDVSHIQLAAGADEERSAAPIDSRFEQNLVISDKADTTFSFFDDISGITFKDNIANYPVDKKISEGFNVDDSITADTGYNVTVDGVTVGASKSVKALTKDDVGPSWYTKKAYDTAFGSGKVHEVSAGTNALFDAVANASDGDVLLLNDGVYNEQKIVYIDKALVIKAKHPHKAKLLPQRSALFEIKDNGALSLSGLVLSGEDAPDATGNTLIRTQKWGLRTNYRFEMDNTKVVDLTVNHSYHFFAAGARSFAKSFSITHSQFSSISGHVLKFNKEKDDLGIYNVEMLHVSDNSFTNIEGALALVYRGGRDESTFGPQVTVTDNVINNVGKGKRNSRHASLFFHGVQIANVTNNLFEDSAPISIELTVGEPQNHLSGNKFDNTAEPRIVDFLAQK